MSLIAPWLPTWAGIDTHFFVVLASTLCGIAVHRTILGTSQEWDLEAPRISLFYVCVVVCITLLAFSIELDSRQAVFDVAVIAFTHATGIFTSIFVYRTSLVDRHRLLSFPGPWWAKVSHFYIVFLTIRKWHLYEELQVLHATYGDYVRIGPNTISITDPAAVKAIHGPQSKCSKGPMYDIAHPRHTLHFLRDRQEHAQRRRDWRRGMSRPALTAYEPKIAQCVSQLVDLVSRHVNEPVNAAVMFNLFSFDTMGVVGFGRSFGRMQDGKMDYYMKSLHKNTLMAGTFFQTPWIMQILKNIPLFNVQYTSFIAHSRRTAEEQMKQTTEEPRIFKPIVDAYEALETKSEQNRHDLYGDADLIVVAGSDTIAAVLCAASFCLAQHPQHVESVRRLAASSSRDAERYVNAIIYEALRLHPVIASGLQRITPSEGLQIDNDVFIPGNVRVQTPSYVMFRDERFFVHPDEFIPARFMDKKLELILNASVYIPFNTGVYSCIGKELAMKELNMALTELMTRFDIRLAPGQTEAAFLRAKRDTFTLFIKDLQLVFSQVP